MLTPQDAGKLRADIEARLAHHASALAKSDLATALTLYAEDAVVRPANTEPVRGSKALRTFFQQWLAAMKIRDVTYTTEEFEVLGEKAIYIGAYNATVEVSGTGPATDRGSFTVIWKQQPDGAWLYHRGIFNSSLPVVLNRPPT
jgi:uncharacterized protein (TIGR02246 family)